MKRRDVISLLAGVGLGATAARSVRAASSAKYPASAAETRAGVMPTDLSYEVGDVRRYGVSPQAKPAENAAALQRCLNANAGASAVRVPAVGADFQIAGRVTVPAKTSIILGRGARLRWVSVEANGPIALRAPTRPGLEVQGDGFTLTGQGQIVGPATGGYSEREIGLLCVGPSASARRSGFTVADGVEFLNWGSHGIMVVYTKDIVVRGIKVHNCGYAGMQFLSCLGGQIQGNEVGDITPGTAGNAYGISCTHDSKDYGADPHAADDGRLTANPFCTGMVVESNIVYDIPQWTGIDFHGAYECRAHNNKVFNCRNGVLLQGSSGDGVDFAGEHNTVSSNAVTTRRRNGEPTTIKEVTRLGISVNGGHRFHHRGIVVRDNTVDGYGDSKATSFSLQHTNTSSVEIRNNKVTDWRGYACYSAYSDGIISGNEFGPPADPTSSACIFVAIGGNLQIVGNKHSAGSGRGAMYGVYINTPTDAPYAISGNDFSAATQQQYAGHGGARLAASQIRGGRP